jgi:hypothetical protein
MRKGKKEEKEVKLNKKSKKRQMRGGKKKPWQQGIAGFAEEDRRYGKGNGSQRVWTTEEESRETEEQGRAGGVVDHEETGGRLWRQNKRKNLKHGKKSRDNFHHQASRPRRKWASTANTPLRNMQSEVQLALPFYLVAHTANPEEESLFSDL